MAKRAVEEGGLAIRVACQAFQVSQSCYRYEAKTSAENDEIANWLLKLTDNHRNWGFGLCFLYLRNVKKLGWNHKRVYRIPAIGIEPANQATQTPGAKQA